MGRLLKHLAAESKKEWYSFLASPEEALKQLDKFAAGRRINPTKKFPSLLSALGAEVGEAKVPQTATRDQMARFALGVAGL